MGCSARQTWNQSLAGKKRYCGAVDIMLNVVLMRMLLDPLIVLQL